MHAVKLAGPVLFLSTLSLRRATKNNMKMRVIRTDFYPRSPCGERPCTMTTTICIVSFLSTLSLRRATSPASVTPAASRNFYPRSPCGERRIKPVFSEINTRDFYPRSPCGERRASDQPEQQEQHDFYPRSPCGERQDARRAKRSGHCISIHALLAESDRTL